MTAHLVAGDEQPEARALPVTPAPCLSATSQSDKHDTPAPTRDRVAEPVVGVGDRGHRYTTCGHCVEPDCSVGHTSHHPGCVAAAPDLPRDAEVGRCSSAVRFLGMLLLCDQPMPHGVERCRFAPTTPAEDAG